jgi:two-component system OmpR family sensor kinase
LSLYWKIFVSFSIAMTLTLIGAVLVSFRLAEQALDQDSFADRGQLISAAALALQQDGESGLRKWLESNGQRPGRPALLVIDESGNELLGRRTPRRLLRLTEDLPTRTTERPRNFLPRRLMPRLVGPDGREYRLVFARPPRTLFGVLDWPSTQIAVLIIAIGAASITALLLARYLAAPIEQLQRASRALAAGEFHTRVGDPSNRRSDEVGALARDFDAMAERIQALVTAKETLLRDVSHELRSPLARIRVALALAERHTGERARAEIQRIEEETERLDQLGGQVMMLTRLRTELDVRRERVSVRRIINEIIDNARFEHPAADILFEANGEGEVLGDPAEIKSAIENVVRNALAFAGVGGVRVGLDATRGYVEVHVADSGPGVATEDLERIFEPFYQTDNSRDHERRGEGIGLAITARVLRRHGGRVMATNLPEGGLEITLTFPAQGAPAAIT